MLTARKDGHIMKKQKKLIILALALSVIVGLTLWPKIIGGAVKQKEEIEPVEIEVWKPILNHRQEVWLYVLEWCESQGRPEAVNQVDRDGTPSYYSFQFKPSTFRFYGEKYGVIEKGLSEADLMEKLKSYELQREIVKNMIFDNTVKWTQQFPDCVKKYGLPPK